MEQRALLRIAVDGAHARRGPAEVELFPKGGGSAEAVGQDRHERVVDVGYGLVAVRQGHGGVEAGPVGVAVQAAVEDDVHVGNGGVRRRVVRGVCAVRGVHGESAGTQCQKDGSRKHEGIHGWIGSFEG